MKKLAFFICLLFFLFLPTSVFAQETNSFLIEAKAFQLEGVDPSIRVWQDGQILGDFTLTTTGAYQQYTVALDQLLETSRRFAIVLRNGHKNPNGAFRGIYFDKIKTDSDWFEAEEERTKFRYQQVVQPDKPIKVDDGRTVFALEEASTIIIDPQPPCDPASWRQPNSIKTTFPRLATLKFGRFDEKLGKEISKLDLLITSLGARYYDEPSPEDLSFVRSLNPKILIMGNIPAPMAIYKCTQVVDDPQELELLKQEEAYCYQLIYEEVPKCREDRQDWFWRPEDCLESCGDCIEDPDRPSGQTIRMNLDNDCPYYNERRWNEFLAETITGQPLCQDMWDGFLIDQIDEHPDDLEEREGAKTLLKNIREGMRGLNYYIVPNIYGNKQNTEFYVDYANGRLFQEADRHVWHEQINDYIIWSYREQPYQNLPVWHSTVRNHINPPLSPMEDFQTMRFMLGLALLGNGYFVFDESSAGYGHNKVYWYDEYSVNLKTGRPTVVTTSLLEDISAEETSSILVDSSEGFDGSGSFFLESELIHYQSKDQNHFYDLTRALAHWSTDPLGFSIAKPHSASTLVYQGKASNTDYLGQALGDAYEVSTGKTVSRLANEKVDFRSRVFRRNFKNGMVLVNTYPDQPQMINNLNGFKRINGIQDPQTNNGQSVNSEITIPPLDALILIKKPGDVNGDGLVDEIDYAGVITHFGEIGTPGTVIGDVYPLDIPDGIVDERDYATIINFFGT